MNQCERLLAVLHYENYDRLPVLHFGFWGETMQKWAQEGHLTIEEVRSWGDGNLVDKAIGDRLGFDGNYYTTIGANSDIKPHFQPRVLEELPDGSRKVLNGHGVVIIQKEGTAGIPPEVDHLLKDRQSWEKEFLPRLRFNASRVNLSEQRLAEICRADRQYPLGLHCGSLYGRIRDWTGMVNLAYIHIDDPKLFAEMIEVNADLSYQCTEAMLDIPGAHYDFGHFWEDICFKSGPLINPAVFRSQVGPGYRRITDTMMSTIL